MNRGPHRPLSHARALELAAQGMVPRYITRELNADPTLAEERDGTPIPRRTVCDWVQAASDDGTLAAMRAAIPAETPTAPAPDAPAGASGISGATGAPGPRPVRRSRIDVLHDALERLTAAAEDDSQDPRVRVQAEGTIGRIVELIDRMTQGEDAQAQLEELSLTADEVRFVRARVTERRAWLALPEVERHAALCAAGNDDEAARLAERLRACAFLAERADVIGAAIADYRRDLAAVGAALNASSASERTRPTWWDEAPPSSFGTWMAVLAQLDDAGLVRELLDPRWDGLAQRLEVALFNRRGAVGKARIVATLAAEAADLRAKANAAREEADAAENAEREDFIAEAERASRKPWESGSDPVA